LRTSWREGHLQPGAPHGITATHQDQINAELLAFLRS
jgi:hypothetical protein